MCYTEIVLLQKVSSTTEPNGKPTYKQKYVTLRYVVNKNVLYWNALYWDVL